MWIGLLGPVEVRAGEKLLDVGPKQRRAVLAALAADAGRVVPLSALVDRVWGETPPDRARAALYSHIARLRSQAVPLVRRSGGYLLDIDPDSVDACRLSRLSGMAQGCAGSDVESAALAREAAGLWRGEPLPGLVSPWADRMRTCWMRYRVEAMLAWAEAQLRLGDPVALIAPLDDLVAEQPLVERLVAAYMRVLCAAGRPAQALVCFEMTRRRLAEGLGADPGPELRDLHHAILRTGAQVRIPARRQECQLRAPIADFVGREQELGTLLVALRGNGIALIQGMAGVGKTELAVLAATRARESFPDAQLVVNLRGLPVARALRQIIETLRPDAELPDDDPEALQRHYCALLSGRRMLVLADDVGDATQVRPLVPPPGSALLVTSRQRFTLPGMATVDLGPLSATDSVSLLKEICARVPDESAATIVQACGFLPLAIRVSASVLSNNPALPVRQYVEALTDRRLRLSQLRDPDDAELDVAASLGLSYAALDGTGRSVLRQLAVFAGDFDGQLAPAVLEAPDSGQALHVLLRRNLIGYDAGRGRWRLHDLVRDFARQQLEAAGDADPVMARYARAVVRLVEAIGQRELTEALAAFDAERSHVDAAREWIASHGGDELVVAEASATFGLIGFMRYERRDQIVPAVSRALEAARRLGDTRAEALMLNRLGQAYLSLDDPHQAIVYFGQQLSLASLHGDVTGQARALNNLGLAYMAVGEPELAVPCHERQLRLARELGDRRGEAMALCNLGSARADLELLESALALARDLGDRYGESNVLLALGRAHLSAGAARLAVEPLQQALEIVRAMADRHNEMKILHQLHLCVATAVA